MLLHSVNAIGGKESATTFHTKLTIVRLFSKLDELQFKDYIYLNSNFIGRIMFTLNIDILYAF